MGVRTGRRALWEPTLPWGSLHGHRGRGAQYLLSQRGHDVLLFPDADAWVTRGVIVDHCEPQQTAHAAKATWEARTQLVFRQISELREGVSLKSATSSPNTPVHRSFTPGPPFSHLFISMRLHISM